MKSTHEVLTDARAYIANRKDWTQFSRGGHGQARCALGAVDLALGAMSFDDNPAALALARQARAMGFQDNRCPGSRFTSDSWLVANFNNRHTHEEVLALFDGAIAAERPKDQRKTDISVFTAMLSEPVAALACRE